MNVQLMVSTAADVSVGTGAVTVLQVIAATGVRVKILAWGIYFNGTNATGEPALVRLLRQTTAGSSGVAESEVRKVDDDIAYTITTTALRGIPTAPTTGDMLKTLRVHPQNGYEWTAPFGGEIMIGSGDRVGIEATAIGATLDKTRAFFHIEE